MTSALAIRASHPRKRMTGVGDTTAAHGIDPAADAERQLELLKRYVADPSNARLREQARAAVQSLDEDIKALATSGLCPHRQGVWVSGGATAAIAAGSALMGGVVGFIASGKDKRKSPKENKR